MSESENASLPLAENIGTSRRLLPTVFWALLVPSLLVPGRPWLSGPLGLVIVVWAAWRESATNRDAQHALLAGPPAAGWAAVTATLAMPLLLWTRVIAAPFIMMWPQLPVSEIPDPGQTAALVSALLFAPVIEEVMFRGVMLPALQPWGRAPALAVTATVFGLAHGPSQFLATAVFGWVLGWLALEYRSIWPSVALHLAFNLSSGVLLLAELGGMALLVTLLVTLSIGGLYMTWRGRRLLRQVLVEPWQEYGPVRQLRRDLLPILRLWPVTALISLSLLSWLLMLVVPRLG